MGIAPTARIDRGDLAFPRFLATMLFALAAAFALPVPLLILDAAVAGRPIGLVVAAVVGLIAYSVGRLGLQLWTGRPLPRRLVDCTFALMLVVPLGALLTKGSWVEAVLFLAIAVPVVALVWNVSRGAFDRPTKPKPEPFDDLA